MIQNESLVTPFWTGRKGMTTEQVLRCAVLKQYRELTHEELAFHLEDSDAFRTFSRLEMGQYPSKSILQENIKSIGEDTWEAIHGEIIRENDTDRFDCRGDRHPSPYGFNAPC